MEKFKYMVGLSDKMPITLIPVEVPCQAHDYCETMTSQAMWCMSATHVWYLKPMCSECIVESGHTPLEPVACGCCGLKECICDEHEEDMTPEEKAAECAALHPGQSHEEYMKDKE